MIEQQTRGVQTKIEGTGNVQEIRCRGTILALELKTPEGTSILMKYEKRSGYFLSKNILLRHSQRNLYCSTLRHSGT
jgi:adenosylmethionine-8-amino-7-oxononanoate aminotransferase